MIFITVGTTMPFDELVEEADRLAGEGFFGNEEIICQSGQCAYMLENGTQFRGRESIQDLIDESSLILSHGGVTVVQLLMARKPFVCFPNPRAAGSHQTSFVTTIADVADISWSLDVRDMARLVNERRSRGPAQVRTNIPKAADIIRAML